MPLADLKAHLSIVGNNDDNRLAQLEWAAVDFLERQTNRCLVQATWLELWEWFPSLWNVQNLYSWMWGPYYPFFPGPLLNTPIGLPWQWGRIQRIELSKSPVVGNVTVQYYDQSNVLQTLASNQYNLVTPTNRPAYLQPVASTVWPIPYFRPDAVQITYTAGPLAIPDAATVAIKLLVGAWNENREDFNVQSTSAIPIGVEAIIQSLSTGYYV